jgi:hypothetical protein
VTTSGPRSDSPARVPRLAVSTTTAFNLFAIVGLLGIYLKLVLLNQQWDAVARFLGRAGARELGLFDRLGFFFDDVILNLLVVPFVGAVIARLAGRRAIAVAFGLSVVLAFGYFVQMRVQSEVGQYLSRDFLGDLLGFAAFAAESSRGYLSGDSLVNLSALLAVLAAVAGLGMLAVRAERRQEWTWVRRHRVVQQTMAVAFLLTAATMGSVGFAARIPDVRLNRSAIATAATTLLMSGDAERPRPDTVADALAAFRIASATPALDREHPLVGRERGADLLVFMMETGPARAFDLAAIGRELPGVGALFERSLIARRHYTSHPYSSDALYSVLSGLYPQGRRRLVRDAAGSQVNGLMSALSDAPVRTVFVPSLYSLSADRDMYAIFGARLYAADEQADAFRAAGERRARLFIDALGEAGPAGDPQVHERLLARLAADFQLLERTKAAITAAGRQGQRYAVIFYPEIGHAPWLPVSGEASGAADVAARGAALMRLQDTWLRELVDTIRAIGRLDRTVIAVTADHGVRTRAEEPSLAIGRLNADTFHVPLLVFAPRSLSHPVFVDAPSSHVDLAPTLLALLGQTGAAEEMVGVPIWQRRKQDRLFFFGGPYGGADGFLEDGTFSMRQALSGAVYRHDRMSFPDATQVDVGDPLVSFVNESLDGANRMQQAVVSRLIVERRQPPARHGTTSSGSPGDDARVP